MAAAGTSRQDNAEPRMSGPIMKEPTFDKNTKDKYAELRSFKLEVSNMLQTFNLGQIERLLVIKNWQGREGLQLIATLTQEEQESCNDEKGLFDTIDKQFKPHWNETIKFLQFHELARQSNESTEEWIGRLRATAAECNYQEIDRQLKEQYVHRLNEKEMLAEMIRELMRIWPFSVNMC